MELWISLLITASPVLADPPSLEWLEQNRIISPEVRQLLERKGADTPEKRSAALDEACRTGELSWEACKNSGRGERRRHY
ncbi:MAG: hypothetical protein CL862_07050 [Cyanobium sp. NAT70]|nr:hypothetical protein [Cyanobium sp. NAT70]|tara:strand:+ start:1187 stop:1426 length:240 start_codon:yes stop_codon:yes gene_type:complete